MDKKEPLVISPIGVVLALLVAVFATIANLFIPYARDNNMPFVNLWNWPFADWFSRNSWYIGIFCLMASVGILLFLVLSFVVQSFARRRYKINKDSMANESELATQVKTLLPILKELIEKLK